MSGNVVSISEAAMWAGTGVTGGTRGRLTPEEATLTSLMLLAPPGFNDERATTWMVHTLGIDIGYAPGVRFTIAEDTIAGLVATGDTVRWLAGLRSDSKDGAGSGASSKTGEAYEVGLKVRRMAIERSTLTVCKQLAQEHGRPPLYGKGTLFNRAVSLGCRLNFLQGKSLYDVDLAGIGEVGGKGDTTTGKFVGFLDKVEWNRKNMGPGAYGCSLDLALALALTRRTTIGVGVNNLIGFIEWNGARHVDGMANTDTVTIDREGYISYAPTMTGSQSTGDVRYEFPRTLEIGCRIDAGHGAGAPHIHVAAGTPYLRVAAGATHLRIEAGDLRLRYDGNRLVPGARVKINVQRPEFAIIPQPEAAAQPSGRPRSAVAPCSGFTLEIGYGPMPGAKIGQRYGFMAQEKPLWSLGISNADGNWALAVAADTLDMRRARAASINFRAGVCF
ncbi:MAG TPA: hypothetical protein GX506_01720 [Firmicutes bacterium]|nr:hypothetical protein [Bacillota bacterium]